MGNICPCPAFLKRTPKNQKYVYDVHEQTFQMQQTVKSQNIQEMSPKDDQDDHDDRILTDQLRLSEDAIGIQSLPKVMPSSPPPIEKKIQQPIIDNNNLGKNVLIQAPLQESTEQIIPLLQQSSPLLIQEAKPEPPPVVQVKPNFSANILKPKTVKKKFNPDDYRFKDENDTFKVKKIDSIKEQQYNIDNCHGCTYFIFDITANLYIDDSTNCTIFVAPCQSTIFVRNCKNLTLIAATKQFRTYQCHQCTFSLYCKSQPVIQSSSELNFTTFDAPVYPQLAQQFAKVKLQPWNNHWSEIHNFTKKSQEIHYTLHKNVNIFINWTQAFEEAQLITSQESNPIPFINGQLPYEPQREILILVNQGAQNSQIYTLLSGVTILRAFQGVVQGEGKQQRKVLNLDIGQKQTQPFEALGRVFTDAAQIQENKTKWLVTFGDQRNQ